MKKEHLLGVVLCGGRSSRMGIEKSMINYHGKEQRYLLYDLLQPFCASTIISCNNLQSASIIDGYEFFLDNMAYSDVGPMAGIVTAHEIFPDKDILVLGCDYPMLRQEDLEKFLSTLQETDKSYAFFNSQAGFYEPLLAYYSVEALVEINTLIIENKTSLQKYLRQTDAKKFVDYDCLTLRSIDNQEEMQQTIDKIKTNTRHA